jgi:hypothetical protein
MAQRGGGEMVVLSAAGRSERDDARLAELFTAERDQEWPRRPWYVGVASKLRIRPSEG